jgi:hypothetical protein
MSPTQLVRLSSAHLHALSRLPNRSGGGRPIERAIALAVVAVAIALPVVLVLCGVPTIGGFH